MQRYVALTLCAAIGGCAGAAVDRDERFVIHNAGGFTAREVQHVRSELEAGVKALEKYLGPTPAAKFPISVQLLPGFGISNSNHGQGPIQLYWVREGRAPVIHELTHMLAGYTWSRGHWTQEGFASYMQDKYAQDSAFPTHRLAHALVKVLQDDGSLLPMSAVMADRNRAQYFGIRGGRVNRWLAYTQSTSFSTYLIEKYGAERFLRVYDVAVERADFTGAFGKPASVLVEEWLAHVATLPGDAHARAIARSMKQ